MGRLRTGPQPLTQVRGSRPRVGVCGAARGRSQVVALLRVLWNLTSPVDGTATPGRHMSPKTVVTPDRHLATVRDGGYLDSVPPLAILETYRELIAVRELLTTVSWIAQGLAFAIWAAYVAVDNYEQLKHFGDHFCGEYATWSPSRGSTGQHRAVPGPGSGAGDHPGGPAPLDPSRHDRSGARLANRDACVGDTGQRRVGVRYAGVRFYDQRRFTDWRARETLARAPVTFSR